MKRREFIALAGAAAVVPLDTALAQTALLTKAQSDALNAYEKAVDEFKSILNLRRAQIDAKQALPDLPGQEIYLARNKMIGVYKDLTDALPARIGRPSKFGMPPAYFDADNEPLLDEYRNLFEIMEAPPANAQNSDTPLKDVVDLATDIARAKGLDAANVGERADECVLNEVVGVGRVAAGPGQAAVGPAFQSGQKTLP